MSWGRRFPFIVIGPLGGIAVRFGGSKKVFPDSDPYGGLLFTLRVHLSRAPARSRGPVEGWLIFVIVFPHAFFPIKTEGLSRAMIFLYGRIMVLGELLMG